MAKPGRPRKPAVGKPAGAGRAGPDEAGIRDEELERRRRELEATLAARRPEPEESGTAASSGATGYGQALKLSSEFIAGVAVGAGLGWAVDRVAGTSPWGLIVLLLLGFGAGVLNVLRSAGLLAQQGRKRSPGEGS